MSRIARPAAAVILGLALVLSPLGAALAATSGVNALAADGDVTWSVEPAPTPEGQRRTFDYSVDPGTQIVDSIVITNQGETSADFLIYATDAVNELETGAFSLLKRDEPPTDVGAWIATADEKLTLGPGMQATVPFNLLVPSDAAPGDHVAGIVASVLTAGVEDGAAVTLEQRVGARVYLTVSGVREAGIEVSGVTSSYSASWNPFAPGTLTARYDVRNTGNTRLDINQALVVTGPFGIPLGEYVPEPLSDLLPRQTVRVSAELPSIAALLLAWSTVTVLPGAIGTAGELDALDSSSDTPVSTPVPQPTESTEPAADDAAVTDIVVTDDQAEVEYLPVSATVATPAISWTLAAILLVVVALIFFMVRYVSGTRERMYLAIDEATAAAREEALAGAIEGPSK